MASSPPALHEALLTAAASLSSQRVEDLFSSTPERATRYGLSAEGLTLDFSKHLLDDSAWQCLLELAEAAEGGLAPLQPEAQARLEELMLTELPKLNPTPEPARNAGFSAEWECRWTSEKEINFAREKGLFGRPWRRTYQRIDIAAGTLTNVLEFEDAELTDHPHELALLPLRPPLDLSLIHI